MKDVDKYSFDGSGGVEGVGDQEVAATGGQETGLVEGFADVLCKSRSQKGQELLLSGFFVDKRFWRQAAYDHMSASE